MVNGGPEVSHAIGLISRKKSEDFDFTISVFIPRYIWPVSQSLRTSRGLGGSREPSLKTVLNRSILLLDHVCKFSRLLPIYATLKMDFKEYFFDFPLYFNGFPLYSTNSYA